MQILKLYFFISLTVSAFIDGIYLIFWNFEALVFLRLLIAGLLLGVPLFIIYYLKYGEKLNELFRQGE